MRRLAPLLLALAAAAPARALVVDDLRLQWSPRLGTEFTANAAFQENTTSSGLPTTQETATQDAHRHDRYALAYRHSFGGLRAGQGAPTIGLEFGLDRVRQRQQIPVGLSTFSGDTWMLDLFAGWSWRVTSRWHVEQGVLVGAGAARWTGELPSFYSDGGSWTPGDRTVAYEYGFAIASAYEVTDHLVLGLDVRHLVTRSRATFAQGRDVGGTAEVGIAQFSFRVSGFGGAAFAGYRF